MTFARSFRWLAVAGVLALGSGCGRLEDDQDRSELANARRQWRAQGLTSYDIRYRNVCFCVTDHTAPVRLEVRNGAIAGAVRLDTSQRLGPDTFNRYRTVDAIFDLIDQSIDANAAQVDATYDASRGFPVSVYIDQDTRVADEEIGVETSDLVPR
jgi:hypothetical protein